MTTRDDDSLTNKTNAIKAIGVAHTTTRNRRDDMASVVTLPSKGVTAQTHRIARIDATRCDGESTVTIGVTTNALRVVRTNERNDDGSDGCRSVLNAENETKRNETKRKRPIFGTDGDRTYANKSTTNPTHNTPPRCARSVTPHILCAQRQHDTTREAQDMESVMEGSEHTIRCAHRIEEFA